MADFNAAGTAALNAQISNVRWMAWLDIVGDTVRVTDAPMPLAFAGTGDPDLDGYTFGRTDGLISISEVAQKAGGSDTVTAFLSALPGIDTATLNMIGNKANFQGRTARLWMVILDPDTNALISIAPYYTGYMMTPRIAGSLATQTVALEIESYLAAYADPSNRTYLDQVQFDAGDTSAAASVASANGFTALGNIAAAVPVGGYGSGFNFGAGQNVRLL